MLRIQTSSKLNPNSHLSDKRALICVICGSIARGYNFGAITCMSCKIFFRRNALARTVNRDPNSLLSLSWSFLALGQIHLSARRSLRNQRANPPTLHPLSTCHLLSHGHEERTDSQEPRHWMYPRQTSTTNRSIDTAHSDPSIHRAHGRIFATARKETINVLLFVTKTGKSGSTRLTFYLERFSCFRRSEEHYYTDVNEGLNENCSVLTIDARFNSRKNLSCEIWAIICSTSLDLSWIR